MTDVLSVESYSEAYGFVPCDRFRRFTTSEREQYDGREVELPHDAEPQEVRFTGSDIESFLNEDWPDEPDPETGMPYGHISATEIDFERKFKGWVPLATLGEESARVLVCRADTEACPVALWESEDDTLYPLAESLDAFLSELK